MRVRAAASQSHPADRGAGQRGPQPTRGRSAESVPGVSGGRGGRARSGSSYSDVRCSVPSGPHRGSLPAARTGGQWTPLPRAHSREPRGTARLPQEGTPLTEVVGGPEAAHLHVLLAQGPALQDGRRALWTPGGRVRGPREGPCPDPLMRPPEAKSPSSRSWTEAVGCGGPPSPGPLRSPWRELGTCGQRRAVTGESAPGSRLTLAGPQGRGARRQPGLGVTHPRAPRPPPDPDRGRLRAWPGLMINRRLWGPDRAQSA